MLIILIEALAEFDLIHMKFYNQQLCIMPTPLNEVKHCDTHVSPKIHHKGRFTTHKQPVKKSLWIYMSTFQKWACQLDFHSKNNFQLCI
jgi:hypothetical protein